MSGLTALTNLDLNHNDIVDIKALAGLTALTALNLSDNDISDIAAVAGLTELNMLDLSRNEVSDLAPLVDNPGISDWDELYFVDNQIDEKDPATQDNLSALSKRNVYVYLTDPC